MAGPSIIRAPDPPSAAIEPGGPPMKKARGINPGPVGGLSLFGMAVLPVKKALQSGPVLDRGNSAHDQDGAEADHVVRIEGNPGKNKECGQGD